MKWIKRITIFSLLILLFCSVFRIRVEKAKEELESLDDEGVDYENS